MIELGISGGVSLALAWLLVVTRHWHGHITGDNREGIQRVHSGLKPRVGGLPIFVGIIVACYFIDGVESKALLSWTLIAGVPAFVAGLLEDTTKRVGVTPRFLATMGSGLLAWLLMDVSLTRVDVVGIDYFLKYTFFSLLFSTIGIAGIANAINIIDGMNGLAALAVIVMLIALGWIAYSVGDAVLLSMCLLVAAATFGFFVLNWPLGKIFLGDGGAYFLGFCVAWFSILLIERNSGVSAFAPLLICVHPVIEVLFSIYRRWRHQTHPGHPDRLHFHSLFKRRYARLIYPHSSLTWRNSFSGLVVGALSFWGLIWTAWGYDSTSWCILGILIYICIYLILYMRMVRHKWIFCP